MTPVPVTIPLAPVPSQTLAVILANQNCGIAIYTESTGLYFDLTLDGVTIKTAVVVRDGARLLEDTQYTAFIGDFVMVDTQGNLDPVYTGLGTRWVLCYLGADYLAALQ